VQSDVRSLGGLEAGLFDGDFVSADRQAVEEENAGVGSGRLPRGTGFDAQNRYVCAGHGGTAGVGDGAGQRTRDFLGRQATAEDQETSEENYRDFYAHKNPLRDVEIRVRNPAARRVQQTKERKPR